MTRHRFSALISASAILAAVPLASCDAPTEEQKIASSAASEVSSSERADDNSAEAEPVSEAGTALASEKERKGVNGGRRAREARAHAEERGYESAVEAIDSAEPVEKRSAEELDRALVEESKEGDLQAVANLLVAGAKVDAVDGFGRTPLLWAVTNDHIEVAELLLSFGANVNAVDEQKDSPWLVTGVTGSADMGLLILGYDVDFSLYNRYGGTPIIPASERGHLDYVQAMVQEPKITVDYLNHINNIGWTALLEAVILGDGSEDYQEIVRTLIDAGADPTIADADEKTPLDHARAGGQREVAAILQKATR